MNDVLITCDGRRWDRWTSLRRRRSRTGRWPSWCWRWSRCTCCAGCRTGSRRWRWYSRRPNSASPRSSSRYSCWPGAWATATAPWTRSCTRSSATTSRRASSKRARARPARTWTRACIRRTARSRAGTAAVRSAAAVGPGGPPPYCARRSAVAAVGEAREVAVKTTTAGVAARRDHLSDAPSWSARRTRPPRSPWRPGPRATTITCNPPSCNGRHHCSWP